MLRKVASVAAMTVVLVSAGLAGSHPVSVVINGSFERDSQIADVNINPPQYWCEANIPDKSKFRGSVGQTWSSHGDYALTFSSEYDGLFDVNDAATISQQVYLKDVNGILFDIALTTEYPASIDWDSELFSAFVQIDGNDFWDSCDWVPNENGEYFFEVNGIDINDANLHTLTIGMRANKSNSSEYWIGYRARWDFVRLDTHCDCGDYDYPLGDADLDCYIDADFDFDCHVNELDLKQVTDNWLYEWVYEANWIEADLNKDGVVDLTDFGVVAGVWLNDSNQPGAALLAGDIDITGEVYFGDIAMLRDGWLTEGCCIRADVYEDGVVDLRDFAVMANQWLKRSWLYGLD